MKNTKIISTFPGCGKTYCFNKYKDSDIKILDSDSSNFSWLKDENGNNTKERNPEFPINYINHIKENIGKVDVIFVSSHDVVRKALKDNLINYILVYPTLNCKENYIYRYINRGNNISFINFISKNYDKFIKDMMGEEFPDKVELHSKETIDDLLTYGFCTRMIAKNAYDYFGCPIKCNRCLYRNTIL